MAKNKKPAAPMGLNRRAVRRDSTIAWLERTNPLKGLSIAQAINVFDCARGGDTQRLHWMFAEIERVNPILLTCVERRAAALAMKPWQVTARPSGDETLGDEEKQAVEEFLSGIGNFGEMVEHLDNAFFRGFSYAQPIWENGFVKEVSLLPSWQFLEKDGVLLFNPACNGFTADAQEVDDAWLIGLKRERAIDFPALSIHIREAVGERDWGRFLERYALPKPAVFMAENATQEQRGDYLDAANKVENGEVSVWPAGTNMIDFAGGSRGTDPFSSFIRHQEELIVLLSTGGTLTSLAQADTGSLAGGAQMDVWREIVARDARLVAQALQRDLISRFLDYHFPGQAKLVDFSFDLTTKPTPKEMAEVAAVLKSAGYSVNQEELEEATGFTLEKDPISPPMGGGLMMNKSAGGKTPLQNDENRLQNAPSGSDAQGDPSDETPSQIAKKRPNKQLKKRTVEELLEEAMAEAMAEAIENSECRAKNPATCRVHGTPPKKDFAYEKPKIADASGAGTTTGSGTVDAPGASAYVPATAEAVEKFKAELPKDISPAEFDSILTTGFEDTDGAGNKVMYGTLLRDHINNDRRNAEDLGARKRELGNIVRIIRETKPVATTRAGGKERIYTGYIGDKAYIAVADEHNEIGAFVMVSYRRNGKHDKK